MLFSFLQVFGYFSTLEKLPSVLPRRANLEAELASGEGEIIAIVITTTTTTVSQLLLIPSCKQVFISGAVELTTQLSKPVCILCVPKCQIDKLGYLAREDYLDPLQLRVIKYCFLAPLPWTIALFTGLLEVSYLLHVIHYG